MERLKGKFMVYQRCGYIGTGDKVLVTNQKQEPLLPPEVERAIRERERKGEIIEKDPPPDRKKQEPLLPPFIKTVKK